MGAALYVDPELHVLLHLAAAGAGGRRQLAVLGLRRAALVHPPLPDAPLRLHLRVATELGLLGEVRG